MKLVIEGKVLVPEYIFFNDTQPDRCDAMMFWSQCSTDQETDITVEPWNFALKPWSTIVVAFFLTPRLPFSKYRKKKKKKISRQQFRNIKQQMNPVICYNLFNPVQTSFFFCSGTVKPFTHWPFYIMVVLFWPPSVRVCVTFSRQPL